MGSLESRLERLRERLEASTPSRAHNAARERLRAKLAAVSEMHRASRERGEEPGLEGQSFASLLGLVESYPHGEVPPQVAEATRGRAAEMGHSPESIFAKMARTCLRSRGAA